MASEEENKWEAQVSIEMHGLKAEQVWPLLEDFFNIHILLSKIDTCYGVEGTSGRPGCIRYCAANSRSSSFQGEETGAKWALEKLVAIDPTEYCFSYVFVDNNCGFDSYMATTKLVPLGSRSAEGCKMIFSFVVSPVEGSRLEDLTEYYNSSLQNMAKRIEEVLGAVKEKI